MYSHWGVTHLKTSHGRMFKTWLLLRTATELSYNRTIKAKYIHHTLAILGVRISSLATQKIK